MKKIALPIFFAALMMIAPALIQPAAAACTGPAGNAGNIIYNSTQKTFEYCNNILWIAMNPPGSGAGGCATPTLDEGKMVYNEDSRVLQGCVGNVHRAMGPVGGGSVEWTQIAAGSNHTCAVRNDGRGFCWGLNHVGQLGDSTTINRTMPAEISGGYLWSQLSVGELHTCGITTGGVGYCWGEGQNSRLGTGTTVDQSAPAAISGGGTWIKIDASYVHSCGIKTGGNLYCWGAGASNRMGDGATSDNSTPGLVTDTAEAGSPDTWIDVSAGYDHGCGIQTSGNAYCWGDASNGALGQGSSTGGFSSPQAVSGGLTWKKIFTGQDFSCAITSADIGYCWGYDNWGANGNGSGTVDTTTPVLISGGGTWSAMDAGFTNVCGVKDDNNAYCWGGLLPGTLGNGTYSRQRTTPAQVNNIGSGNFTQVGVGYGNSCGLQSDGEIYCWGNAGYGQLGNGVVNNFPTPQAVMPKYAWTAIDATRYHACGIKSDQSLWCWGLNETGEVGIGAVSVPVGAPTAVSGGGSWAQVSTGGYHTCARKTDNTLWCWGEGANGRLGRGSTVTSATPVQAGTALWKHVSTGNNFSCGIMLDSDTGTGGNQNVDEIYCWGSDGNGQQGNGAIATADQLSPAIIAVAGPWTTIESGWQHACAIKASDSTLWCWGSDSAGQQGNGATTGNIDTPAQIGIAAWIDISGAQNNTCGLQSGGLAWCWGLGANGQNGDGTTNNQTTPIAVSDGHVYSRISVGNNQVCAIRASDKRGLCWGHNIAGKVGNGSFDNALTPSLIASVFEWRSIASGEQQVCGVTMGDLGLCWGGAHYAQIGNTWNTFTTGQQTGCGAPEGKPGAIIYNTDESVIQYCDGAGWVAVGGGQ